MIKSITLILLVIFVLLEYRFWCSNDSILQTLQLKKAIVTQQQENSKLRQRNDKLFEHISDLKRSPQAIEEQARYELGMVKRGEKFYQIVEPIE